jgi:hypothetical protein
MAETTDTVTYHPAPGGMVDTARKAKATAAQHAEGGMTASGDAAPAGRAVPVREALGDVGSARVLVLAANQPQRQLLPRDLKRRAAVIIAVDNDVYITPDEGTASGIAGTATALTGFYLPKGTPIPIVSTAEFWVACTTTASTSRVSVLYSRDSV